MANSTFFSVDKSIYSIHGKLDPWTWSWVKTDLPESNREVTAWEALEIIHAAGGARRVPVGVIGPRNASDEELRAAEAIGRRLGQLGLTMICGGKTGVMAAAAKGCHEADGLSVGLLPDHDWRQSNPYIQLPIATGLSEGRNMIIAKSCEVLMAVGGSYGTLTEIAYGLHFGKPVIGLLGAPRVEGLVHVDTAENAIRCMATFLLDRVKPS